MTAVAISVPDLLRHRPELDASAAADLITGIMGRASRIAPCVTSDSFPYADEAKALIRDAILRRVDSGTGGITMEMAGPFQRRVDTTRGWGRSFTEEEEDDLRAMCAEASGGTISGRMPAASFPASPILDRRYRAALGIPPRPLPPW